MNYPQHEKLEKVQGKSQVCGEFLEWLNSQGYHVARYGGEDGAEMLYPIAEPINSLLARFFDIDEDALEAEKVAMIDNLRAMNESIRAIKGD